jgi:hypothetical protein
VAEEGRGENEVVQPVNSAANVATNAAVNPPANAAVNAAGNVANNAANAAGTQPKVTANPSKKRELSIHQYKPTMLKEASVDA